MKKYVKPEMKLKSIEVAESIAKTCWGLSANGTQKAKYISNGETYNLVLNTTAGCSHATLTSVAKTGLTCKDESQNIVNGPHDVTHTGGNAALPGCAPYEEMAQLLTNAGGSNGSNVNGEGGFFPDTTQPS